VKTQVNKETVETKVKETETISIKTEEEPTNKRKKIDTSANMSGRKEWLRVGVIKLRMEDRDSIMAGSRLNDLVINVAHLLKNHFPKMKGLCSLLLQNNKKQIVSEQKALYKSYIHEGTIGSWQQL